MMSLRTYPLLEGRIIYHVRKSAASISSDKQNADKLRISRVQPELGRDNAVTTTKTTDSSF